MSSLWSVILRDGLVTAEAQKRTRQSTGLGCFKLEDVGKGSVFLFHSFPFIQGCKNCINVQKNVHLPCGHSCLYMHELAPTMSHLPCLIVYQKIPHPSSVPGEWNATQRGPEESEDMGMLLVRFIYHSTAIFSSNHISTQLSLPSGIQMQTWMLSLESLGLHF